MLSFTTTLGIILVGLGLYFQHTDLNGNERLKKSVLGTLQAIGESIITIAVITLLGLTLNLTFYLIVLSGILVTFYAYKKRLEHA